MSAETTGAAAAAAGGTMVDTDGALAVVLPAAALASDGDAGGRVQRRGDMAWVDIQ